MTPLCHGAAVQQPTKLFLSRITAAADMHLLGPKGKVSISVPWPHERPIQVTNHSRTKIHFFSRAEFFFQSLRTSKLIVMDETRSRSRTESEVPHLDSGRSSQMQCPVATSRKLDIPTRQTICLPGVVRCFRLLRSSNNVTEWRSQMTGTTCFVWTDRSTTERQLKKTLANLPRQNLAQRLTAHRTGTSTNSWFIRKVFAPHLWRAGQFPSSVSSKSHKKVKSFNADQPSTRVGRTGLKQLQKAGKCSFPGYLITVLHRGPRLGK